jgi:hypothetical protein
MPEVFGKEAQRFLPLAYLDPKLWSVRIPWVPVGKLKSTDGLVGRGMPSKKALSLP